MSAFISDWLNLLIRWAHLVVGIGWIGTSFYFIALDFSLRKRERMNEGVYGTAWLVHGGGFYHVEKYLVAPKSLPPDLVWYRWEAYLTWVTGFALLVVHYYWHANLYLIDRSVLALRPSEAVVISVASLAAGWFVYDWLCRSWIGRSTARLALCVFVLIVAGAWFYENVFSGRGALIHVGAFVGTMMAVNVFGVIIPNQKKITAALLAGREPDPALGATGKQRSLHNNYLTLPVLVMMVSNHYPMLTGHPQIWLLVALIVIVGATVRHFFNRHDAGDPLARIWWTLPVAAAGVAVAVILTWPRAPEVAAGVQVSDAEVLSVVGRHCVMCHSAAPTYEGIEAPPKGVTLTTIDSIRRHGPAILRQAVQTDAMPLGNETHMTDEERARLGAWLRAQRD
jgi:uncharacterized membrane protein